MVFIGKGQEAVVKEQGQTVWAHTVPNGAAHRLSRNLCEQCVNNCFRKSFANGENWD
jgi:hypothetical protein